MKKMLARKKMWNWTGGLKLPALQPLQTLSLIYAFVLLHGKTTLSQDTDRAGLVTQSDEGVILEPT